MSIRNSRLCDHCNNRVQYILVTMMWDSNTSDCDFQKAITENTRLMSINFEFGHGLMPPDDAHFMVTLALMRPDYNNERPIIMVPGVIAPKLELFMAA